MMDTPINARAGIADDAMKAICERVAEKFKKWGTAEESWPPDWTLIYNIYCFVADEVSSVKQSVDATDG